MDARAFLWALQRGYVLYCVEQFKVAVGQIWEAIVESVNQCFEEMKKAGLLDIIKEASNG